MSARPEADEANYLERRTVRTVDARPMRTSRLFDALPPYLGGKRRLVPLILADLAAELPPAEWPGASFCDPMCGGGAVALAAKAQGFEVYASDRARRGAIVAAVLREPGPAAAARRADRSARSHFERSQPTAASGCGAPGIGPAGVPPW